MIKAGSVQMNSDKSRIGRSSTFSPCRERSVSTLSATASTAVLAGWVDFKNTSGFVKHPATRTTIGRDGPSITQTTHPVVAAKLRRVRRVSRGESSFLKAHARILYKITVPTPVVFTMNAYAPGVMDKVHPIRAALAHDLAHIIRDELLELVEEGVPYI